MLKLEFQMSIFRLAFPRKLKFIAYMLHAHAGCLLPLQQMRLTQTFAYLPTLNRIFLDVVLL